MPDGSFLVNLQLSEEVLLQSLQTLVVTKDFRRHPFLGTADNVAEALTGTDRLFAIWAAMHRESVERVDSFVSTVPPGAWEDGAFRKAVAAKVAAKLRQPEVMGDALQSLGAYVLDKSEQADDDRFNHQLAQSVGFGSPEYELNRRPTAFRLLGPEGAARGQSMTEAMDFQMAWALVETLTPSSWNSQQALLGAFPDRRQEHHIHLTGSVDPRQPFSEDSVRLVPQGVLFGVGALRMGTELVRFSDKDLLRMTGGVLDRAGVADVARQRAENGTSYIGMSYRTDGELLPFNPTDNFDTGDIDRALPPGGELRGGLVGSP